MSKFNIIHKLETDVKKEIATLYFKIIIIIIIFLLRKYQMEFSGNVYLKFSQNHITYIYKV